MLLKIFKRLVAVGIPAGSRVVSSTCVSQWFVLLGFCCGVIVDLSGKSNLHLLRLWVKTFTVPFRWLPPPKKIFFTPGPWTKPFSVGAEMRPHGGFPQLAPLAEGHAGAWRGLARNCCPADEEGSSPWFYCCFWDLLSFFKFLFGSSWFFLCWMNDELWIFLWFLCCL